MFRAREPRQRFTCRSSKACYAPAAQHHQSLRDMIVEVNSITYSSIELNSFITLTCGAFDAETGMLSLVRAGHLPLLHYSAQK